MLNLVSLKDRLAHFWPAERGRGWPVTKGLFVARDYRYFYAVQFILVCIIFFLSSGSKTGEFICRQSYTSILGIALCAFI